MARTLASLLSFSALSRCCSSKLFGRRFSLNSSTSFSLSCARAASCAAFAAGSEYIFSCASRKSLPRVAASLGVSVQSAIVDASRSTNVLGGERRDVAGRCPRARAHLRRELGHPFLPSRRPPAAWVRSISRHPSAACPAACATRRGSRSPASHSSNPSIFFFLLAHRVHGGALRRIEQRLMRLLDDVKGGGGVGVLVLVRVDQQTHAPVRLLEHSGGGLLGGTPRTSYASLPGSASAAKALSAAAIFASIPVSSASSTPGGRRSDGSAAHAAPLSRRRPASPWAGPSVRARVCPRGPARGVRRKGWVARTGR